MMPPQAISAGRNCRRMKPQVYMTTSNILAADAVCESVRQNHQHQQHARGAGDHGGAQDRLCPPLEEIEEGQPEYRDGDDAERDADRQRPPDLARIDSVIPKQEEQI